MGIFDVDLVGIIAGEKQAKEYIDSHFKCNINEKTFSRMGSFFSSDDYVPVIWLPRLPKTTREYAVFAHEVTHAAIWVFKWASTPVVKDTEELFAHTIDYIITNLFKRKW